MLGEDLFKKNFIARKIERITYSRKEYIIAVSNAALDDYKKYILFNEQNAFVIYNSVEEKYFEESYKRFQPGNKVEMIAVGNLKALKNFDYLLDASRELPSELFHLDIFGDGPLRDHLQQRIINENLPVSLKGSVSNLHERFREYDLYLHCSKYEGSSLAIFEAMAKGLATAVSKLPVHIENTGGYGVYSDLSNPSDLANKLKAVQAGEIEINENGEKGFRWVKTVAHPKIVLGKTAEVYENILK
jgi:glycosyltransferase involved in cell wall biosynthesis